MSDTPHTIQLINSWPIKALVISFLLGVVCAIWVFPPEPYIVTIGCEHTTTLVADAESSWYDPIAFWQD